MRVEGKRVFYKGKEVCRADQLSNWNANSSKWTRKSAEDKDALRIQLGGGNEKLEELWGLGSNRRLQAIYFKDACNALFST